MAVAGMAAFGAGADELGRPGRKRGSPHKGHKAGARHAGRLVRPRSLRERGELLPGPAPKPDNIAAAHPPSTPARCLAGIVCLSIYGQPMIWMSTSMPPKSYPSDGYL